MKLHYYPETDSLYIELRGGEAVAETREMARGLNADFNEKGDIVGFDIDDARQLDLSSIEVIALPLYNLKAA